MRNALVKGWRKYRFQTLQNWHFQRGLTFDFCSILMLFEALSDIQKSERDPGEKFAKIDGPDGPFAHLGAENEKK